MKYLLLLAMLSAAHAAPDFTREVRPILESRCFDCHDAETKKGGVALDSFFHGHQPSDTGEPLLVPGRPAESLLLKLIVETDPDHRMPKKEDPLSAAEIETLRAWIAAGALWPDDGWRPPKHWAYVCPDFQATPPLVGPWNTVFGRNEIDVWVYRTRQLHQLKANPEADPAALLRRLSLDLTGLPPTVEEVDAFLADPSDAAYERAVDRLLASPRFGERWARHWLDLARYADSEGYQRDELRSLWPWRDWVIAALNQDMPFDRFTLEQLAGDLLPDATVEQRIATGFQRNSPLNLEAGTDPREDHYKQVVDRVNTFGSVWLGTTIGCAQCHNHKYDPISTQEYYQLFAFFNQTPLESKQQGEGMGMSGMVYIGPDITIAQDPQSGVRYRKIAAKRDAARAALLAQVQPAWDELANTPDRLKALPANVREVIEKVPDQRTWEEQRRVIVAAFPKDAAAQRGLRQIAQLDRQLAALESPTSRVMEELPEPRPTFVAKRGDFLSPGARVEPAVPAVWPPLSPDAPRNRLGLARWLTHPDHPLVARVTVNRLWAEIFGRGIVPTLDEFGTQGEPPSHPELLDWLAFTFVNTDGWSLKKALRRIVTSSTYRQSSAVRPEAMAADPLNQWFWRHPGHRLDAETIRDNGLFVSGLLSTKMGGPPIYPYQPDGVWRKSAGAGPESYAISAGEDAHRRGIYTIWKRNGHYANFAIFDAPERSICTIQRAQSNTPLQALALMNDRAYVEMTEALAGRIGKEFAGDLERAFRTVLGRHPTEAELRQLRTAYDKAPAGEGAFDVAAILLNLHETIHR
jgi:hypothetical protein